MLINKLDNVEVNVENGHKYAACDIKQGDNIIKYGMPIGHATVKKAYVLLNEYFRTMYLEEMINKNPMDNVEMIKKSKLSVGTGQGTTSRVRNGNHT